MARELVDDELWEIVRPLRPPPPPHKSPAGRKRFEERSIFTGTIFILQTGLPWELLPKELGCGSGMLGDDMLTPCTRLAEGGVWEKLHCILLAKLRNADRLDFSRVIADSSSVRAVHGKKTELNSPSAAPDMAATLE